MAVTIEEARKATAMINNCELDYGTKLDWEMIHFIQVMSDYINNQPIPEKEKTNA